MKVIRVINMFVCISYVFSLQARAPYLLLTFKDPISHTDFLIPWRRNKNMHSGYGGHLETEMPLGSTLTHDWVKYKSDRGLACLHILLSNGFTRSGGLSFPLLCALFCASTGPTVSVTMATISVSGEYLAIGWSAIIVLLKALSQKI